MSKNATAEIFIKNVTSSFYEDDQVVGVFDKFSADVQEAVIEGLDKASNDQPIKLLPYNKYREIYDKVIKTDVSKFDQVISGLSKYYYEDAKGLLEYVFRETQNEAICQVAAKGLARSADGLSVLEDSLQMGSEMQQVSAAVGINHIAGVEIPPRFLEILRKHRSHENYRVRIECVHALQKSKNLTPEFLRDAVLDEDERVRRRLVRLIRKIDSSVAKEYILLLEDNKGYIVSDVLDVFIDPNWISLDDEAVANAIINELIVRDSGRPPEYFNTEVVSRALQALFKQNSRLYGQTLKTLCDLAFSNKGAVRRRASLVAVQLNERGFLAQINEGAESNPESAKEILNLITGNLDSDIIANRISGTDPADIQQNAANQIKLLAQYHESGLQQAKTSFNWAIVLSLAGFPFLMLAIYYLLTSQSSSITAITSAVASVLVEFVAGTLFYLYNQTRKQLTYYHQQMNQIQRFLLANSVAESLEQPAKENARLELIRTIANTDFRDSIES